MPMARVSPGMMPPARRAKARSSVASAAEDTLPGPWRPGGATRRVSAGVAGGRAAAGAGLDAKLRGLRQRVLVGVRVDRREDAGDEVVGAHAVGQGVVAQ